MDFIVFCFCPKLVPKLSLWCSLQRPLLATRTHVKHNPDDLHRGLLICSGSSSGMWARSPFPCTHKTFSPRLQEQLMNSWEPNLAHLKYYYIVHHNDGNNLVMTVHEATPCTKCTASHTPCLSLVNTKKAFHSPSRGRHCWKSRWSLSSWHSGLWPWILRAVILWGYSFPSPRGFNAYRK